MHLPGPGNSPTNTENISVIIFRRTYIYLKEVTLRTEAVVRRCSGEIIFLKFRKINRKTPVPESLFK